ncbi:hypothetical protein [Oscillibacter sp.]|uniref:hypothetical protein n=1 Tax=Oscillibacter sp. TaxID=1945593 RepID=UPI00289AFE9E|nr:hypothetical protein [Oscillibacter sp.]
MKRKMMSLALALVMCLTLCVPAFASTNEQVVTLKINDELVTYYLSSDNQQNIVKTTSKGKDYIIVYDKGTGDLTINGEKVNTDQSSPSPLAWVEYARYDGVIGVDVRDASVIAGAIIALASAPWGAAVAIAGVVVGRDLDNIYYTKISYYDIDQGGSRPQTKAEFHFYADSDRTEEL